MVCLFFELCEGTLTQIIAEYRNTTHQRTLSEQLNRHWFAQISKGLEYIHRNGIIHMDLKEDNILYQFKPGTVKQGTFEDKFLGLIFKISDFGRAQTSFDRDKVSQKKDLYDLTDILIKAAIPRAVVPYIKDKFIMYVLLKSVRM